jgi:hypothetical protein
VIEPDRTYALMSVQLIPSNLTSTVMFGRAT